MPAAQRATDVQGRSTFIAILRGSQFPCRNLRATLPPALAPASGDSGRLVFRRNDVGE